MYRSKLTADQVVEMRTARAAGASTADLAATYKLCEPHVRLIVRGRAWREEGGPLTPTRTVTRKVDPWFLAASMGLSWRAAKLFASETRAT